MADDNYILQLQLELDDLLGQILRLQGQVKDVDIEDLAENWKSLARAFQDSSERLRFRPTSNGKTEILEISEVPVVRVKVTEINEALQELHKNIPNDTVVVVEINQDVVPDALAAIDEDDANDSSGEDTESDLDSQEEPEAADVSDNEATDDTRLMEVIHVVYDPVSKRFVPKDAPKSGSNHEITDGEPADEVCKITWDELSQEVGPVLASRCRGFCAKLKTASNMMEGNIEVLEDIIRALKRLDQIAEENYFVEEKEEGSNKRSIAMYRLLIQEIATTNLMLSDLIRALPQLETEPIGPFEEKRPFPNAWL